MKKIPSVSVEFLNVFLYGIFIGQLRSDKGELSFTYDKAYLEKQDAKKLSTSLPLQDRPFEHAITAAFFSGLLPDDYVRTQLARYLHLSDKNIFALLKAIGGECAGAVSVYPEGVMPDLQEQFTYRALDVSEANHILNDLDKRPMMAGEDDVRISGAGAQNKLMVAFVDGKIAIPLRNTPSTHIIKPPIKGLEDPVQNEFFCMTLAKRVGLPVPEVHLYWIEKKPYYLVDRYDRILDKSGRMVRLHQEDFCQARHIPPEIKYESEGGPTLQQCFSLLDEKIQSGTMPGRNKIILLKGVLFNFLIGNGDAHGKNFSLLYQDGAESLAPFYDLMSTAVYFNVHKSKMAMKISGKYKFNEVMIRHLERLAVTNGFRIDFFRKQLQDLAKDIHDASEKLCIELNEKPETKSAIYEKINLFITGQCARFFDLNKDIPG